MIKLKTILVLIGMVSLLTGALTAPRQLSVRVGIGSPVLANGISVATLYSGYWTPPEGIIPPSHSDLITDFDPLQTTFPWMYDTVTNRADILAELARLQTEWGTEAQKTAATMDNTFYVDWDTGDNGDDGLSSGNAWKDLLYAVNYVITNHDGEGTEILLMDGVQYLPTNAGDEGTGDPPGGAATVRITNWSGTAIDPMVIRSDSGNREDCIVRIDHVWLANNFDYFKADTYETNCGIQITGTTEYVEFWDFTVVGPVFEAPQWHLGGDTVGIASIGWSGTQGTVDIINVETAQWSHCGFKGVGLNIYGSLVIGNGSGGGGAPGATDHGIYVSDNSDTGIIEGCVIINNYGEGANPRTGTMLDQVIRGNVIANNGDFGLHVGGLYTIVENNVLRNNNSGGMQWGGEAAGLLFRNNAIYEDNIDLQGKPPDTYLRAIGFTWTTNAALIGETPDSLPTIAPWLQLTDIDKPSDVQNAGNNYFYRNGTDNVTTGTSAPVHTSGEVTDGSVLWQWVNASGAETTGTFTTIDSADFNDFAAFDHRPATVSDLKLNGTEYGHGTTIGAHNASP